MFERVLLAASLFIFLFGASLFYQGNASLGGPIMGAALLTGGGVLLSKAWDAFTSAVRSDGAVPSALSELRATAPSSEDEAPWRARPEWRSNVFTHENEIDAGRLAGAVLAALVGALVIGYVVYNTLTTNPGLGAIVPILLALALGIGFPWAVGHKVWRQYKFGESHLAVETMPARLGDRFEALLFVPMSSETVSENEFSAELVCARQELAPDHTTEASSRRPKRSSEWVDEIRVEGRPRPRGEEGLVVPISFDLPADVPPSSLEKTTERVLWELTVMADLPGLDYAESFEVPVLEEHAPVPTAVEEAFARYREPDTEPTSASAELGETHGPVPDAVEEAVARYRNRDAERSSALAESDKIHVEGTPAEALRVSFEPGGALTLLGYPLFGGLLALAIGGLFLYRSVTQIGTGGIVFGGLIFVAFAGLLLYIGLREYTYSGEVRVENGVVMAHRGPFGLWETSVLPASMLEDVRIPAMGGMGTSGGGKERLYQVRLAGTDPSEVRRSEEEVELAESFLQKIGTRSAETALRRMESMDQQIKVGSNVLDRPAAKQAADRILEAAKQQAG